MSQFKKLFEPGKIGSMEVKNRVIMAPLGTKGLCELDGSYNQRGIDYYVARARGGTGLIISGSMLSNVLKSHLVDGIWSLRPRVDNQIYVARLNELAERVHHYGVKIAAQLTAGAGRLDKPTVSSRPVAPSALPCSQNPDVTTRALTLEEIHTLIKSFGKVAKILKLAEFDAIELHGHAGYLFDQFKTPLWNKRTDQYGGDLEGRLRFSLEVIEEIKGTVGEDLPIIYRFSAQHYIEGGREIKESQEIAQRLEASGVNALDIDVGCYEAFHWFHPSVYHPPGCMVESAMEIKKVVNIPVIAVGKLGNPLLAEKVLQEGKADFIALGRALLADPDWAEKAKQARFEDIRPCISDYDGCHQRVLFKNQSTSCTVNPQTGMEREYALIATEKCRNVLVIGGGPAGLEAARVAALRGHQVTLWEKEDTLGGNLLPASTPDFKQDVRNLINYFSLQIKKLRINLELCKEATPELVRKMNPEVVIVATGAKATVPEIPGVKSRNVVTAIDLLMGRAEVGKQVIVAGGGVTGCEAALYLAQKGKKVVIIETMERLIPEDTHRANRMTLLEMINDHGVSFMTRAQIMEITGSGVAVSMNGINKEIAGDSVVVALGLTSQSQLMESFKDSPFELFAIGDCVKPRKILNAIWEGFHTSRLI